MRTLQHIVDTQSIKRVLNIFPDHWVIRELTERDYGIDLFIEIFEKTGANQHGHDVFDSTGAVFHAQIKGTGSALKIKQDNNLSYLLNKESLLYMERFSIPFLLFRVDVSSNDAKSYFLWIQRYIRDVLDLNVPTWRADKKKSFSVNIPTHNEISLNFEKIEKIALRPQLIQEVLEFRESYFYLSNQLYAAASGKLKLDSDSLEFMVRLARQINNLRVIFKYNNCCINKTCAEELLSFVQSLDLNTDASVFSDIPNQDNFALLASSIDDIINIENFLAENDNNTIY